MLNKTVVSLVGATGTLGSLIADALLCKSNVTLRCLVRSANSEKAIALKKRGAEIYEGTLNVESKAALNTICAGAHTIISAVQGGTELIIDGQMLLFCIASDNKVKRFIPSTFSYDIFKVDTGENVASDMRKQFAEDAEQKHFKMEVIHILNGCFLDKSVLFGFLGAFDLEHHIANLWGDGVQKMNFTTFKDTALYTSEVAIDEKALPPHINFAGDSLTFHELVSAYEEGSGKQINIKHLGSMDDLDKIINDLIQDDPSNIYAYLPLMYYRAMLNGKGELSNIMNNQYPHIKPMSVKHYVSNYLD